MALRSAYDDFVEVTLRALPATLSRVLYIRSLKKDGGYHHWGLEKVYGVESARLAIDRAQAETLVKLLRSSMQQAFEKTPPHELSELQELVRSGQTIAPASGPAQSAHLDYLFTALAALSASGAGPQAA